MPNSSDPATGSSRLLDDFSVEITGKDTPAFDEAVPILPPGTAVNVTYLGTDETGTRIRAAEHVLALGFRPIPHLSARRLNSRQQFEEKLAALAAAGVGEELFLVGGDPATPEGPFQDALELIRSGLLNEHGVRRVGITGYPEGHPQITSDALWSALLGKVSALEEQSIDASITTQFGFDAGTVADWIADIRAKGIELPVRVGVPGPAGIRRLLGYARRFGVQSSSAIVQKYGFSLTSLMGTAGPDRFMADLDSRLDDAVHGKVGVHFYTFGGVKATAEWVRRAQTGAER